MPIVTNIVCGAIACGGLIVTPHLNVESHAIYGEYCKNCHCDWEGHLDPKFRDVKNTNIVLHVVGEDGKSREEYLPMFGTTCNSYLIYPPKQCEYPVVGHFWTTNIVWKTRPAK